MFKPINLKYMWDKESFLDASKVAYDYELKHSSKRFLGWLFIAMTQFGVVAAMKKGSIGLLLVSSVLVVYWYFFRWKIRKRLIEKSFDTEQKFHVNIDENKITINENHIKWDSILEVVSLEKGFLVFYKNTFLFFPSKAFKDIDEKNAFAQLAKEKAKNYIKD